MRTKLSILSLLLLFAIGALARPIGNVYLADPTIVFYNGEYYLTGTEETGDLNGFNLYKSKNLKTWSNLGPILKAGNQCWGTKGFWAPQLIHYGNRWLLFYTANEQVVMASSDKITGPFVQDNIKPIDQSEKNIDPFLFIDDNGKTYLYHVRFNHGNYLWCGEFDIAKGEIIPGTLKRCFGVTQKWEDTKAFPSDPIMEGPTVIKRNGKYYLFYSANHFMSPDYAVGYAVSDNSTGPWQKYQGNPIIHRNILGESGDGHGDIFNDAKGNLYYVYHVHNSENKATPRRTRIVPLKATKDKNGSYVFKVKKNKVIVPYMATSLRDK